jgi:hypothetical protein
MEYGSRRNAGTADGRVGLKSGEISPHSKALRAKFQADVFDFAFGVRGVLAPLSHRVADNGSHLVSPKRLSQFVFRVF